MLLLVLLLIFALFFAVPEFFIQMAKGKAKPQPIAEPAKALIGGTLFALFTHNEGGE